MTEENYPIIFPKLINHDEMAKRIGDKILSAGFVNFRRNEEGDIVAQAYGSSITLNLESREEDSKIITRHMNLLY